MRRVVRGPLVGSVTGSPSHPAPPGRGTGHLGLDRVPVDLGVAGAQPHEELHVARRARAAGWWSPPGLPSRGGAAAAATAVDRVRTMAEVAHHAALAEPLLADLELRLDHQHQVAVGPGDADQRVQHERRAR